MKQGIHNSPPARDLGVVFIEFALVLPAFLLMVFFFIEIARYMAIYSAVNAGADQAISFAQKAPGLEKEVTSPEFERARASVIQKAEALARSAFLSSSTGSAAWVVGEPELILPTPIAGQSQVDAFAEQPITLRINASMRPLIPNLLGFTIPDLPIQITATAFREQAKVATVPVPVDCFGNPQGSSSYREEACPCEDEERQYWDYTTEQCICNYIGMPYGYEQDGPSCRCRSGTVDQGSYCSCPESCGELGYNDFVNYSDPNSECACSCYGGSQLDPETNTCTCPAGSSAPAGGGDGSDSSDPNGGIGSSSCTCDNPCTNGKVRTPHSYWSSSPINCDCSCPTGTTPAGDSCACPGANQSYNTTTGACDCTITQSACTGGMILDTRTCECVCPANTTLGSSGSCECTNPNMAYNSSTQPGTCTCTLQSCTNGRTLTSDCRCQCPAGTSASGDSCTCSNTNTSYNPATGQCACQLTTELCQGQDKVFSAGSCSCNCPDSRMTGSTCNCPANFTKTSSGCSCNVSCGSNATKFESGSTCECRCNSGFTGNATTGCTPVQTPAPTVAPPTYDE